MLHLLTNAACFSKSNDWTAKYICCNSSKRNSSVWWATCFDIGVSRLSKKCNYSNIRWTSVWIVSRIFNRFLALIHLFPCSTHLIADAKPEEAAGTAIRHMAAHPLAGAWWRWDAGLKTSQRSSTELIKYLRCNVRHQPVLWKLKIRPCQNSRTDLRKCF